MSTKERGVRIRTPRSFSMRWDVAPGMLLANPGRVSLDPFDDAGTANDRREHSRPSLRVGTTSARHSLAAQHAAQRSMIERIADRLTRIAASTLFLVLHVAWFLAWILSNTGAFGLRPFDPFPFGLLTMIVSLEAIFLSIFVLMAQQRESAIAELREELGLQVSLRVEQEVTKTLQLVAGLYTRMGHRVSDDPELHHMLQPLDVRGIERDLLEQIEAATAARHNPMLDDA